MFTKPTLATVLKGVETIVVKLETFANETGIEIDRHHASIAAAQVQVEAKKADLDRAIRVRFKLNELLK